MQIQLFQLACSWRESAPDGAPYATEAEAEAAGVAMARERLESYIRDADDLRTACDSQGVEYPTGLEEMNEEDDDVEAMLAAFSDEDALELSGWDRIEFEMHVYPVSVEVPGVIAAPVEAAAGDNLSGLFSRSILSGYTVEPDHDQPGEFLALDPEGDDIGTVRFSTEHAAWEACDSHRIRGAA